MNILLLIAGAVIGYGIRCLEQKIQEEANCPDLDVPTQSYYDTGVDHNYQQSSQEELPADYGDNVFTGPMLREDFVGRNNTFKCVPNEQLTLIGNRVINAKGDTVGLCGYNEDHGKVD